VRIQIFFSAEAVLVRRELLFLCVLTSLSVCESVYQEEFLTASWIQEFFIQSRFPRGICLKELTSQPVAAGRRLEEPQHSEPPLSCETCSDGVSPLHLEL